MSFTVPDFGPSDLLTSPKEGVRRVKTESASTSFYENRQFRFFDVLDGISHNNQIVYKFTSAYPIVLLLRELDLYEGGRMYLVYGDTANVTFDDNDLVDVSDKVFTVNGDLTVSGLDAHPISGVTVERAIVANGSFASTDNPPNGTIVLTSSGGNKATSAYGPSDQKAGLAAGQSFYLVHEHIGANSNTSGLFTLQWEENF